MSGLSAATAARGSADAEPKPIAAFAVELQPKPYQAMHSAPRAPNGAESDNKRTSPYVVGSDP